MRSTRSTFYALEHVNNAIVSDVQLYAAFRCTVASVQKRHVAIARLRHPAVLGRTCQEVWFIILVVTSTKEVLSLYLNIAK